MRASTLFALTAAVILGLGAATAAKYTGFFNSAPPPPVAKKQDIPVLVAARNLFAGDMIDSAGVKVRNLRPEEVGEYEKAKDAYLPAVVQAAMLRIASKNIYADQPVRKDDLKEMVKPDALNMRLLPQMRATNLALPKERSAGGLVQVGEWVDVFLTSEVEVNHNKSIWTACIAPKVRVISKRNTLWPIFAPLPENKPVDFTLEVNPYRAALLESVRSKGDLTIAPLGGAEQRQLEVQRERLLQNPGQATLAHFLQPDSIEAAEEQARVVAFNKGDLSISEADLIRIFGIRTPPPPLATISVERFIGATRFAPQEFSSTGKMLRNSANRPNSETGSSEPYQVYQFRVPDCPTCGTNKGKKANK